MAVSFLMGLPRGEALADHNASRTTIFAGITNYTDGSETTTGTTMGVGWGLAVTDSDQLNITGSTTSTRGESQPDRDTSTANTFNIQTGVTHFFNHGGGNTIVPFTGGGLSVSAYDFSFTRPDSNIGETNGTGGGAYAQLGLEVRLSGHFTFIPQYHLSVHAIKNEDGDSVSMISSGIWLSLRFST